MSERLAQYHTGHPVCECQPPSKRRTDGQTPGIEFGASVTSGGNNFNEFPDI